MKVGIIGTHCSGKTTTFDDAMALLTTLYERDVFGVKEVARYCPYTVGKDATFTTQEWIFREQVRQELKPPVGTDILTDRTTVDQAAYVLYLYEHGKISKLEKESLLNLLIGWGYTYDVLVYLKPLPLVGDDKRCTDTEYQGRIDRHVREIMWEYEGKHAPQIMRVDSDDHEVRVKRVLEAFGV